MADFTTLKSMPEDGNQRYQRQLATAPADTLDGTVWFSMRRLLPVIVLGLGILAFFAFRLDEYLTFESLREHRMLLQGFISDHMILAPVVFIIVYTAVTAFSLPVGAVMTIAGGFLFGTASGTAFVVLSATLGAVTIFMAAKTALGEPLRAKAGPWLQKFETGFQKNAFNYLLVLRLIPLFPFFVVNLVPAFLGVRLRTYAAATFIGIIPGTFVYAWVGTSLGSIFASGGEFSPAGILTPEVVIALVGLAVLSFLPAAYKAIRARRA